MSEPAAMTATTGIYCKACGYDLRASGGAGRCPECGRAFSPGNPKTFRMRPFRPAWQRALGRWSTRAAILVLALLLFLAGCWGWLYWGWRQEQAVLARISHGSIKMYPLGAPGRTVFPAFLFKGMGPFDFVARRASDVTLSPSATDADLVALRELHEVHWLDLTGSKVTDAGMAHLRVHPKLQFLILDGTSVTDAGLVHVGELAGVRALILNRTRVTDAGLVRLEKLKHLQHLSLHGTAVTPAGVRRLQNTLRFTDIYPDFNSW